MTSPPDPRPEPLATAPSVVEDLLEELTRLHVWGSPLVLMHATRDRQLSTVGPQSWRDDLATPATRTVVAPNNDTLYSSAWFDLGAGDVVVEVPPMPAGRYWSVMLLDAYTHVQYVSRRTHGSGGATVRVCRATSGPDGDPSTDRGAAVVEVPTRTVWVLTRVLVDGPDDLDVARRAQRSITLTQQVEAADPRPHGSPAVDGAPVGGGADANDGADGEGPPSFFARLAAAVAVDPPAAGHPPPPPVLDRLDQLLNDPDATATLTAAEAAGRARIAAAGSGADTFGNGWGTRRRGADFGDDITYRAAFARVSLAGHLPAENRGYTRGVDGTRPVVLRFPPGGDPPVGAFWSLTLYGPDLFFVANEIDRFSIGDRTPGLRRATDGSLTVTIAHDPPLDEHGRPDTANWLPAPAGPAVVVLRTYEGAADVVDATWFPPDLDPAGSEP